MKLKYGPIETMDGKSKDVIVDRTLPCGKRWLLAGGAAIAAGVWCIARAAFKSGADARDLEEFNTLVALGLIKGYDGDMAIKGNCKLKH